MWLRLRHGEKSRPRLCVVELGLAQRCVTEMRGASLPMKATIMMARWHVIS
jgi:hypothetical protein